LTQEQISVAQQQQNRSDQLFNLTEPGLQAAESFYTLLSKGDPTSIARATAPATEAVANRYEQSKKEMEFDLPRGGTKDLAIEEADISKAGAVGGIEANAYLSSFPALANLAGQGIGLSLGEVSSALSAFSGASSSNQAAAQMSGAGKAQTLSFLASLGSSASQGAGLALSCWIAEEIFGRTNLRTARLRVWLNEVWAKESVVGLHVMFLYRIFGQFLARMVRKYRWVRRIFTPIFEAADRAAYRWELAKVDELRRAGVI